MRYEVKAATVEQFKLIVATQWLQSIITIVVAVVLWRLSVAGITKFYARRFVSRFIPRVPTYTSLTKSIVGALIFFFLILELLNIWRVNVAPALWSAGALSVVIGIGAQAIVRDMLTGTFYLFEDTFDVGDGVELTTGNGVVKGLVEAVGLREVRVVDGQGYIISVPYGNIVFVANTTRLPSRIRLSFSVPLRSSVVALRERIKEIAGKAAQSSEVHLDHIDVQLEDIRPDAATFNISFHVSRQQAPVAESSMREIIASALQRDGLLPGDQSSDGRIHSGAAQDQQ
ncbi:MAG: mechanosensitive ion channel family protein [Candidatus Eremiobacteraeota bacterium]|nr:mechanosensitive ion channel family protein [Candidatus Eremiobacteraeota bacterium]